MSSALSLLALSGAAGSKGRLAVLLFVAALLLVATPGHAQEGIDVRSNTARSVFQEGVTFTLEASSPAGFDNTRLVYQIKPDGVRSIAQPECAGGTTVTCTYRLLTGADLVLIPKLEIDYFWRLTTGGVTQETPPQTVTYEDDRFEWQSVSEGNLTVHYYAGTEEQARGVLAAGRESLDATGELLQASVGFPVKILLYASAQEMQPAIAPDVGDPTRVILGEVVYSDTAMVAADYSPEDTARHEIAHIVVREALNGPFDIPDWLDEGTAVFAQNEPLPSQEQALQNAIDSGQVFSVRSLSSATLSAQDERTSLFYGQSYALVAFLIDANGPEDFARLFAAFRDGAATDEALTQVYGFDQDGLENAWRESAGLPPREELPTPTNEPAATPATQVAPPDGDGGPSIAVIVAIAALTIVLAGAVLAVGIFVARRYG